MGAWRHAAVGATVLLGAGLVLAGVIGEPPRDEVFEAKQITVQPVGENGVQIREVVDEDFGTNDRHGYERVIPNDFGVPTDVTATSADAPADVSVVDQGDRTRIRVGDPGRTISGQHRYVLTYTLPDARLATGQLFLDVIGAGDPLETERFEVVVTGLTLADPLCSVGAAEHDRRLHARTGRRHLPGGHQPARGRRRRDDQRHDHRNASRPSRSRCRPSRPGATTTPSRSPP